MCPEAYARAERNCRSELINATPFGGREPRLGGGGGEQTSRFIGAETPGINVRAIIVL